VAGFRAGGDLVRQAFRGSGWERIVAGEGLAGHAVGS